MENSQIKELPTTKNQTQINLSNKNKFQLLDLIFKKHTTERQQRLEILFYLAINLKQ